MTREIFQFVLNSARATCLISLSVYLFALATKNLRGKPKTLPPCETCIHLAKKQKDGPFDNKCWKCEEHGWQYHSLCYCKDYVPREKDEEFEPAESVAVDLEPCPFCKQELPTLNKECIPVPGANCFLWSVSCTRCNFKGAAKASPEEAAHFWNQIAKEAASGD